MSHTVTRNSVGVWWALALALSAATLLVGTAAAEPVSTPDTSGPGLGVPAIRDQWYLDPATPFIEPEISIPTREGWYLEHHATGPAPGRSHRSQEEG